MGGFSGNKVCYISPLFVLLISFIFLVGVKKTWAQNLTQTIQGHIFDKVSGLPLTGVNLVAIQNDKQIGTITDSEGYFEFKNQPIGKYSLLASFVGYKTYSVNNLNLLSGRSLTIDIYLLESVQELSEVSVKAYQRKNEPLNGMAIVGARSFTLDETNRYAGAYGDPARMAMNYAGVLPVRDNRNDIIIRGNSAFGLQWRINDIEIPNPNHFGASGTTGGPITIVNNNLLAKSDFFTGAFPAEYGNAIAGVFDLKMKASNLQKHEKWFQLGWNGLEFGSEGPLKKGKKASYMVSARYGLTGIAQLFGFDAKDEIDYKDFTIRFNFPETKTGTWSVLAMGGNSRILLNELKYTAEERTFETYGEVLDNYTSMGVVGITNRFYLNKKSKITTVVAATVNTVENSIDTFLVSEMKPFLWAHEATKEFKYSASTRLDYKFGKRANLATGVNYDFFDCSFNDKDMVKGNYVHYTDTAHAYSQMIRAFVGIKYLLGSCFETYVGLHGQYYITNASKALEPRFSIKYNISENADLSYGFGMHSQLQPKVMYYVQTLNSNNQPELTNKNLKFTQSIHNVLGYSQMLTKNLHLKLEGYYQYLYNVPVKENQPAYSLINFGTEYYVEREDSLVSKGKGLNYGLELTFEQYLNRNFFYLITASVFKSNYTSTDHITRGTAYDGRYAFNALWGYERPFPKKNVALIMGVNLTYAGGSPYVPYNTVKTVENSRATLDWQNAYQVRRNDYKRLSLRLGIRRNMKKSSMETTLDFQYRTNYTSIYMERIDVTTGEIINTNIMGFYPMINMRISF